MARDPHVLPPVVHRPLPGRPVAPPPSVRPVHPGAPSAPSHPGGTAESPPAAHHRHRDYVYLENYGWWPSWFPYWEPDWYAYWQYLYDYYNYYGGAEYAEYARDTVLRQMAPQWGWL